MILPEHGINITGQIGKQAGVDEILKAMIAKFSEVQLACGWPRKLPILWAASMQQIPVENEC
jgi:hypothetical protein